MDPRTNGHGDDAQSASRTERPRLRADSDGPPGRSSTAASLRAADQLARLEARIREFHRNLESLDAAAAGTGPAGDGPGTATVDSQADSEADPPPAARRRTDRRADGPFTTQRRIDALRPELRAPDADGGAPPHREPISDEPLADARAAAESIRRDAESRAEQLRTDAADEAALIRRQAEEEMQVLWRALENEVETIQIQISRRVDHLAERMDAVTQEAEAITRAASIDAERIRAQAVDAAAQIRREAAEDTEELIAAAEREALALIAEARAQADALLGDAHATAAATDPSAGGPAERNAAERIAEQIRDATAALTRRVSRTGEDPFGPTRELRSPGAVPSSIRDVLDGLGIALSLIERSLLSLAELLGESLGSERPEDR